MQIFTLVVSNLLLCMITISSYAATPPVVQADAAVSVPFDEARMFQVISAIMNNTDNPATSARLGAMSRYWHTIHLQKPLVQQIMQRYGETTLKPRLIKFKTRLNRENFADSSKAVLQEFATQVDDKVGSCIALQLAEKELGLLHEEQLQDLIHALRNHAYYAGVKIVKLDLTFNHLSSLSPVLLQGFKHIRELWLQYNCLSTLPATLLRGLHSLQKLWLNNNQLTVLPEDLLHGLEKLQLLVLDNNKLTTLPTGLCKGLKNLQKLFVEDNALAELPAGLFSDLDKLQKLCLGHNQITNVPTALCVGLSNLEQICFLHNPLSAQALQLIQEQFSVRHVQIW